MGNWGNKTFENDGPCDTLGNVFDDLVKQDWIAKLAWSGVQTPHEVPER